MLGLMWWNVFPVIITRHSSGTKVSRCLNMGSYNYLGFAAEDEYCTPRICSARVDGGMTALYSELEKAVADLIGKPSALVTGMGYVTNSAILPVLIGKGGLIISDSLNHNSIVNGEGRVLQLDYFNIIEVLKEHIADGKPITSRPWTKFIVVVEGIYSMEGEICKLPKIVSVCKRYKACVYFDETHSIEAIGKT